MNINPMPWLGRKAMQFGSKFANTGGGIAASILNHEHALGVWNDALGGFIPRQVNPHLYEALREAIGILDGSIETLVTLDGIVTVEGDNAAIVSVIEDFIESVPVNDAEKGLNAFYASQGNEVYEQGVSVGEWVPTKDRRDIAGLRVADSKGIAFRRTERGLECWYRPPALPTRQLNSGTQAVEAVLRNRGGITGAMLTEWEYTQLDASRLIYVVNAPEADNPYGTSKLRSLEFVGQLLVKIENATGRVWERYGDPPMHLKYTTKNAKLTAAQLDARKIELQKALADALRTKAAGNSMDLVTALGALDDIALDVIGASGIALELEKPVAHLTDQILAKMGTPAWLLGIGAGDASGPTERQSEMVLQSSRTRWTRRKPYLTQLVATMLRLRGYTWKRGDWQLKQELPNLQDMMKIAQANFLNAQAQMVSQRDSGDNTAGPRGIDNNLRAPRHHHGTKARGTKADEDESEPWAEDAVNLRRIENRGTSRQLIRWWTLASTAARVIGFTAADRRFSPDPSMPEEFAFDSGTLPELLALGERYIDDSSGEDGPLLQATWEAWVRGWTNASDETSSDSGYDDLTEAVRNQLLTRGGELIRSTTGRAYRDRVITELASGAYDGMNPVNVAAQLQRKFEAGEYDWERLVTSEMAIAQSRGKLDLYRTDGVELYDWTTAGSGVCPICIGLAQNGPYRVDDANSPIPVVSSHPMCRCSCSSHAPA